MLLRLCTGCVFIRVIYGQVLKDQSTILHEGWGLARGLDSGEHRVAMMDLLSEVCKKSQ